ncbi:MAG: transcriptional coactivator p15/PC4 family protein [Candidatus Saganbacteria bacterium]|nr:transcriptional coactivator p15/PC4 family protein [Candidatus Saganbacteria bacterium]
MPDVTPLQDFGYVEKNKDTRFILTTSEWRGNTYVDLREYYQTSDEPREWLPTKKGVRFRKDLLDNVLKLLEKAKE